MEHVDGVTLSELVAEESVHGRRLPEGLALHIIRRVAEVLAYVHDATDDEGAALGIVHRDVTPQNILVSRRGRVRLGDFGIARSSLRDARTRTGVIKGKLRYVAPEQVTGSAMDGRTDLYALGVVAFELLTGQPYLTGENELALLREAESPTPKRLAELLPSIDQRIDRLFARVLARFPEERPRSVADFQRELSAMSPDDDGARLEGELGRRVAEIASPASVTSTESPEPVVSNGMTPTSPKPPERARWRLPLAAFAALLAVGAGVALFVDGAAPQSAESPDGGVSVASFGLDTATIRPSVPDAEMDPKSAPDAAIAASNALDAGRPTAPRPSRERPRTIAALADPPVSDVDDARRRELSSSLEATRAALGRRGIRIDDLDAQSRAALTAAEGSLSEGRFDDAGRALDALARGAEATTVDAAFVRRKIERVDAAIRRADGRGVDTTGAERLSASALSDFMAGRHEAANRRLNQILDALR
jgi:serine/threonine-protein kinase